MIMNMVGGSETSKEIEWASVKPCIIAGKSYTNSKYEVNSNETPLQSWGYRYMTKKGTYAREASSTDPRFYMSKDRTTIKTFNETNVVWSPSSEPLNLKGVEGNLSAFFGAHTVRSESRGWSVIGESPMGFLEVGKYKFTAHFDSGYKVSGSSVYTLSKSGYMYRSDADAVDIHGTLEIISKTETELSYLITCDDYPGTTTLLATNDGRNFDVILIATVLVKIA